MGIESLSEYAAVVRELVVSNRMPYSIPNVGSDCDNYMLVAPRAVRGEIARALDYIPLMQTEAYRQFKGFTDGHYLIVHGTPVWIYTLSFQVKSLP